MAVSILCPNTTCPLHRKVTTSVVTGGGGAAAAARRRRRGAKSWRAVNLRHEPTGKQTRNRHMNND